MLLLRVLWRLLVSGLLHWRADTRLMSAQSVWLGHATRIAWWWMMTAITMTLLHHSLSTRRTHLHVCWRIRILCTAITHSLLNHALVAIWLLIPRMALGLLRACVRWLSNETTLMEHLGYLWHLSARHVLVRVARLAGAATMVRHRSLCELVPSDYNWVFLL
jgi:hypothetical protein